MHGLQAVGGEQEVGVGSRHCRCRAMKVAQSGDYYSSLIAGNKREYTPKWFFRKVAKFFHQVDLASVDLISRPPGCSLLKWPFIMEPRKSFESHLLD